MYDELVRRLRDSEHEIDCSLCDRDCCYQDGKVHGKCIIIEAADAIEAQDRHILTLQHEMMAEAESHITEVNRLNKQIEELMKSHVDEKTALAMMAGSHAIREHAKRYEGSTYMWDVLGERGGPKEICYLEAAKHLMSIAGSILDPQPPKEE